MFFCRYLCSLFFNTEGHRCSALINHVPHQADPQRGIYHIRCAPADIPLDLAGHVTVMSIPGESE